MKGTNRSFEDPQTAVVCVLQFGKKIMSLRYLDVF